MRGQRDRWADGILEGGWMGDVPSPELKLRGW